MSHLEIKNQLHALLLEKSRRKGKTDLHYLCKNILGYTDLTPPDRFHGEYCRHLESKKRHFKLSLTPRGSLKTSIGTVGQPLQDLINDPDVRILIATKKFTNSVKILSEITGHIEKNDNFRRHYGDLVKGSDNWSKTEVTVGTRKRWRKEPSIMCAGIDVTTTGLHYDRIYVDDPQDDLNTQNQDQIDKVIRWYRLLFSLLDPGGYLFVKGTIWHYNDLYNYIINSERERVAKGLKRRYSIFIRDSFEGTDQELMAGYITPDKLLWPERLSVEFLQDQYVEQGPYIFNCQYRLNPIDDDNATFKRSWLKFCKFSDLPKNLNYYSTVDPMRDEEGKDHLAIPTVAMDSDWNCYIVDCVRMKADEHDTVEAMYQVYKQYKPVRFGFETVAWQKSFLKYVQMLSIMRGIKLPVTALKTDTSKSKPLRIKSMVPYFKAGLFTIVTKDGTMNTLEGGMKTLVDELLRYPRVTNDDCVDALSYVNQLTQRPGVIHVLNKIPDGSFMAIRSKLKKPKNRLGVHNVRERRRAS